jgi:outer membrane protein TolC
MQAAEWATAIERLGDQRRVQLARLNTLLGRRPDAALGPITPAADADIAVTATQAIETAMSTRQELRQQQLKIARMETMITLATRLAQPDPSSGASYFETRMKPDAAAAPDGEGFATQRDLNHRETPFLGQRTAYVRELQGRVTALEHTLQALRDQVGLEVTQGYIALETARRDAALYRHTQLPQARQIAEAARSSYRTGKTSFQAYLESHRRVLAVALQAERALRDHRLARARLDRVAGDPLPVRPLDLTTGETL